MGDGLDNDVYNEPLTLDFRFNPELAVRSVRLTPTPVAGQEHFAVESNRLRLNMVPDERLYTLSLERE